MAIIPSRETYHYSDLFIKCNEHTPEPHTNKLQGAIDHMAIRHAHAHEMQRVMEHQIDALRYSMIVPPHLLTKENTMALERLKKVTFENKAGWAKKEEDSLECRNWEFDVPHPESICYKEILESISRENPVAFVTHSVDVTIEREIKVKKRKKVGDTYEMVEKTKIIKEKKRDVVRQVAFIHESIVQKAERVAKESVDDAMTTSFYGVFELRLTEGMTIQSITEWVKGVKNAKWGVHADREHIHVIIPKI